MNIIEWTKRVWMVICERQQTHNRRWWMARTYLGINAGQTVAIMDLDYEGLLNELSAEYGRTIKAIDNADGVDDWGLMVHRRHLQQLIRRVRREYEVYHGGPDMSDAEKTLSQLVWDLTFR